jgi:hypothetical protein
VVLTLFCIVDFGDSPAVFINSLSLTHYRTFVSAQLRCKRVNVILGANNAGKSSILTAMLALQADGGATAEDIRAGSEVARIDVDFVPRGRMECAISATSGAVMSGAPLSNERSKATFFPMFSRRMGGYNVAIGEPEAKRVDPWQSNLPAVMDSALSLANPRHPTLMAAIERVAGVRVATVPYSNGKTAGIHLASGQTIKIDRMGAGVDRAIRMLIDVIETSDRIFLIEEPENDLHPSALKAFLEVIEPYIEKNQFFVTTHSPIVLKFLAGRPDAAVFNVTRQPSDDVPTSHITQVEDTATARRQTLMDLGHDISDFDLFAAWLVLEESSAERIINNILIPLFVPNLLGKLRTIASQGAGDAPAKFGDLHRLLVFSTLEPIYLDRTWVAVDNDEAGRDAAKRIGDKFPRLPPGRIKVFEHANFEKYYPPCFTAKVESALAEPDKQARRALKRQLIVDVLDASSDIRGQFEHSAAEVITFLKAIERALHA